MIALRCLAILVVLLAAHAASAAAQPDKSSYILFVHKGAGANVQEVEDKVRAVLASLLRAGYSVRKPDTGRDLVGGPGVDYFDDRDKGAAEDVATIVNGIFQSVNFRDAVLKPRLQKMSNPPHYLGVWLF